VPCADCHSRLIHANAANNEPKIVTLQKCESCHKSHADFPLAVGKHATADCAQCHPNGKYGGTSPQCESCHKPPAANHPGGNTDCQACHSPEGWKPAKVDHNKTNFPLLGQHQQVACTRCHGDQFTKPAGTLCSACHQPPASHAGLPGTCDRCHTPQGFGPANFSHPRVGEHMPSGEKPLTCDRCHRTGVFTQHDCTGSGCHSNNNPGGD